MRTLTKGFVAIVVALAAALPPAASLAQPPAKPDDGRADLSGEWVLVAMERDGKRSDLRKEFSLFSQALTIRGDKFNSSAGAPFAGGIDEKGTFRVVGADRRVFRVDAEYTRTWSVGESNREGKSSHRGKELWELVDKDTLRICRADGENRPDKFETKKGDGRELSVYERKKP
jgi:uncharacterized protein (TIGR03067 family)